MLELSVETDGQAPCRRLGDQYFGQAVDLVAQFGMLLDKLARYVPICRRPDRNATMASSIDFSTTSESRSKLVTSVETAIITS